MPSLAGRATVVAVAMGLVLWAVPAWPDDRPNILWVDIDDQSPWYGVYGDDTVATPNIDALARHGVVFERAYAPVPVCAPSRSAMVTGGYPIRLGTHDMRSGRVPEHQIHLPADVKTVPELMRQAGYETYNASKDDYNFAYRRSDLYSFGSVVVDSPGSSPHSTNSGSVASINASQPSNPSFCSIISLNSENTIPFISGASGRACRRLAAGSTGA